LKLFKLIIAALMVLASNVGHAAYTINISESGGDVVAIGSGSLNLAGLVNLGNPNMDPSVHAQDALLAIGGAVPSIRPYVGIAGPVNFGPGGLVNASSGTGDLVGLVGSTGRLVLPLFYVSGNPLASTATWSGATIAGLGLTPGVYAYTWASDSITLNIIAPPPPPPPPPPAVGGTPQPVPTLSEWAMLLLAAGMMALAARRMRRT
jgi:hypothetical protein